MQERWFTVQSFQKQHALNHLTKRRQSESMKPSNFVFHSINGLRCQVRAWDDPGNPQLFLPHSWVSFDLRPGELDWARFGQNFRLQDFVQL
jgi:hypothetical protein